jgi:hypothetical protein
LKVESLLLLHLFDIYYETNRRVNASKIFDGDCKEEELLNFERRGRGSWGIVIVELEVVVVE